MSNLFKESEILIKQVRQIPRTNERILYRCSEEVRRFPYHTPGLVTNFVNPPHYSRITSLKIELLSHSKFPEKNQLLMPILNQLKTIFHHPHLNFFCEIEKKPLNPIQSMNTAKLLDVFSFLFEVCNHSPQIFLMIGFEEEQSPTVQEFINSLLDLLQLVDCSDVTIWIWILIEQNIVLPIEKIVHWLYRPKKTIDDKLEKEVSLEIEVGEMQNIKDIVNRLKKVIC